jgi:hypothetical protein
MAEHCPNLPRKEASRSTMYSIDDAKLNSELRRLRGETVAISRAESPGIVLLKDMLSHLTDPDDIYRVYQYLLSELTIQGDLTGALEWARIRLSEFGDIASRGSVAKVLLELGRDSEALEEFRAAFRSAVDCNKLVNFTFGEFMRAATKVGDVETLDRVSREYLALTLPKSKADCGLEGDWLDSAEALGARQDLIKALRRRIEV